MAIANLITRKGAAQVGHVLQDTTYPPWNFESGCAPCLRWWWRHPRRIPKREFAREPGRCIGVRPANPLFLNCFNQPYSDNLLLSSFGFPPKEDQGLVVSSNAAQGHSLHLSDISFFITFRVYGVQCCLQGLQHAGLQPSECNLLRVLCETNFQIYVLQFLPPMECPKLSHVVADHDRDMPGMTHVACSFAYACRRRIGSPRGAFARKQIEVGLTPRWPESPEPGLCGQNQFVFPREFGMAQLLAGVLQPRSSAKIPVH